MQDDTVTQYAKDRPSRNVAVVGLRDEAGNVLLMRSHKLPNHWQPIGGGIEQDDTSPQAAACRELREEFGIDIDSSELSLVVQTPYDFGEGTVYFFDAQVDRSIMKFNVDPIEVVEYRWFSTEEAVSLPTMPATKAYFQRLV